MRLVWQTSRRLSLTLALLSLTAGALPAGIAWVGKRIVDGVVKASETGLESDIQAALVFVVIELGLVAILAACQRGIETCTQLLRALLAQEVNEMILRKALTLDLPAFEDAEFYDKMTRARREASRRPLSVVMRVFQLGQQAISLTSYAILLIQFSVWAALVLVVAAIPAFIAEARFSKDAFRLFSWRAPETRMQNYLETLITREDHAKEVKLFGLGEFFLTRYRAIFDEVYAEDRALQLKRGMWGLLLGLIATGAFYGAYVWIAIEAAHSNISLGEMTMYLLLFKQGQSALAAILSSIGGMYEDNLYLSNLYDFLDYQPSDAPGLETIGTKPGDGLRFEDVGFAYPGATKPALTAINLHLRPGRKLALVGENGAGKTTLIKLLARLYKPTEGRILLDGVDLNDWDPDVLRKRIGVIFQDFVRYQLAAGENIGVGDVDHVEDEARWREAAEKGMADEILEGLPGGYKTQLGRWFVDGQELSGGQWQKVALARAFMREDADLLILDEPTAAMDAEAEATIFERFSSLAEERMAILISHRFSTVRMADEIVVIDHGKVVEQGDHETLLAADGRYAHLFSLQAKGYL
ncbi:MAG: ABC transporter ATP-binding protein [Polyangiales bacterium]